MFNVPLVQVSTLIQGGIPVLAANLKFLINWPKREVARKRVHRSFKKHYRKCRCIIDCSEICIERPSDLTARAQTWSNYKHHNTMKFLIGITPYGSISFLSKCWGGRVSDKHLTQASGFLDMVEPGDLILADRGFLVDEEVALRGATLIIPPFMRGRKQLQKYEVDKTRQMSRCRIHVERVICRLKRKYVFLQHVWPITMVNLVDDVLTICGSLSNLHPRIH